jgi:hypothetical protein
MCALPLAPPRRVGCREIPDRSGEFGGAGQV